MMALTLTTACRYDVIIAHRRDTLIGGRGNDKFMVQLSARPDMM